MTKEYETLDKWVLMLKERSETDKISSPVDVAALFLKKLHDPNKEQFMTFGLDVQNKVVYDDLVSIGTLDTSIVHPRDVFKKAILNNVSRIIIAHNHPSGKTNPSKDDINITKKLVKGGKILGIEILDHVIIGAGINRSMKEMGELAQ